MPLSPPPGLDQLEVQHAALQFLRLATVWARRSYEDDDPLDRPDDEKILREVVALLTRRRDVPLVHARSRGRPPTVARESSLREYELYCAVLDAIRGVRDRAHNGALLAARIRSAFLVQGRECTEPEALRYADAVLAAGAKGPAVQAGRVLTVAGLRGYSTQQAVERTQARIRDVMRRREVAQVEVIEYVLACLQVPQEDLHALAAAISLVLQGGRLRPEPRPWNRRTSLRSLRPHPSRRQPYARYGAHSLGDPSEGVLDEDHSVDLDAVGD